MLRTRIPRPLLRVVGRLAIASSVVAVALVASPARATNSACNYGAAEQTLNLQQVTPTSVRLFVTGSGEIKWSDPKSSKVTDCGEATVTNTNTIFVTDYNDVSSSHFILDISRPFGPGAMKEVGISEIEISVQGGAGNDSFSIWGGARSNNIVFGEAGVNLNNDSDDDLSVGNLEHRTILGEGNDDVLSGNGGSGTGGPFAFPLTVYGNGGNDVMLGSSAGDMMLGSDGDDTIGGRGAGDIVFGDKGKDVLNGGTGGDELDGLKGDDRLRGNEGADDLEGGAGTDNCKGGSGPDTVSGCELP